MSTHSHAEFSIALNKPQAIFGDVVQVAAAIEKIENFLKTITETRILALSIHQSGCTSASDSVRPGLSTYSVQIFSTSPTRPCLKYS